MAGGGLPEPAALRRFALLAGAGEAALERARRRMRVRVVEAGRAILRQGDEGPTEVFFLLSGRADVEVRGRDGAPVWIASLGPGEVFGEMEALEGMAYLSDVVAAETCRLAVMPAAGFLDFVCGEPALALRVMRLLSRRLQRQDRRIVEQVALDIPGRVARELMRRAVAGEGGLVLDPAPGPTELARAIGARRETVSREIARLLRAGVLAREGARLIIRDPRALDAGD